MSFNLFESLSCCVRFERNLKEKCPYECERKFWRAEVISSEVEQKVATLFGAEPEEISIIEFNHSNNKFVSTLSYESGLVVLVNRLGKKIDDESRDTGCAQAQ